MGPSFGLDVSEKQKSLVPVGIRTAGGPVRSLAAKQNTYRLSAHCPYMLPLYVPRNGKLRDVTLQPRLNFNITQMKSSIFINIFYY